MDRYGEEQEKVLEVQSIDIPQAIMKAKLQGEYPRTDKNKNLYEIHSLERAS